MNFYLLTFEQYLCVILLIFDIQEKIIWKPEKKLLFIYKPDFTYWVNSGNLHALMICYEYIMLNALVNCG